MFFFTLTPRDSIQPVILAENGCDQHRSSTVMAGCGVFGKSDFRAKKRIQQQLLSFLLSEEWNCWTSDEKSPTGIVFDDGF